MQLFLAITISSRIRWTPTAIRILADNDAKIIRNKRHVKTTKALSTWYMLVSLSILRYLESYITCRSRMEASIKGANVIFGKSDTKDSYRACCIRRWGKLYLESSVHPDFRQGKFFKTVSIISREDVRQTLRQLLRNMEDKDRTPEMFMKKLNSETLFTIPGAPPSAS